MTSLPLVVTSAGPVPQQPAAVQAALIQLVSASQPGYTANLPGSIIEDISSTDVGAILLCDAAQVELINSLTPFGANPFLTNQLGQIYGVPLGEASNTSVNVVFSNAPAGTIIAQGFVIGDGTYQYTISDGGAIGASGSSAPLFARATTAGSWAVPAGTVTQLFTSVPPEAPNMAVNNPSAGTPGAGAETQESYRARVIQAGLAVGQGMPTFLKTILNNVPGVQSRLVSVRQVPNNGGWEIIVGGGDPYEVANAIFTALFDISTLVGSTINALSITAANPGVVVTDLNHGLVTGQAVTLSGSTVTGYNGTATATVIDEKTFSYKNTTGLGAYSGGGEITPNNRNLVVNIVDYPDTYAIPFVVPPQQAVTMTVTWNTTSGNIVSQAAVSQLASPALVAYVNGIATGQPMNLFELQTTFQEAIASILDPNLLTRLVFAVSINGVGVSPGSGTGIIAGDPESYFLTSSSGIVISQG
jgi:hypothetical protein